MSTGSAPPTAAATASAFAAEGAEVVVCDVDEVGLKSTVTTITGRGGVAHSYLVDVADADAVERFAEQVCAAHGVPDIVVNNAGIGVAGAFLDTPPEQFDRVLDKMDATKLAMANMQADLRYIKGVLT